VDLIQTSSLRTTIKRISIRGVIIHLNSPLGIYLQVLKRLQEMDNFLTLLIKNPERPKFLKSKVRQLFVLGKGKVYIQAMATNHKPTLRASPISQPILLQAPLRRP